MAKKRYPIEEKGSTSLSFWRELWILQEFEILGGSYPTILPF